MSDPQQHADILFVITKSNWGGAQRYVYDIALAAKETFAVAVALGGHGALAEKLGAANIPVHEVAAFQRDISFVKELKAFVELFTLFRRLRPRVVHLNSSKAGGIGALAAQIAGVPKVIYTSHGLPFEEDRPRWQKALIAIATWFTFILSDTVIVITDANLKTARQMPFISGRLTLVRLGIHPIETRPRDDARAQLSSMCAIPTELIDVPWIGTIAEYHVNKDIPSLIRAVALLRKKNPRIACVIIGDGELRKALTEEIATHELTGHVFLTGFLPDAASYLSAFDIFALTSVKEGLPYVLLEAGSVGLPFVGSALPGIAEVVTDMSSGILVLPKRPSEVAGALDLLIEDASRRTAYGNALKERVMNGFSAKRMQDETLLLYTQSSA